MKIKAVQEIQVPNENYCIHFDNNIYCSFCHSEYANGCWVWSEETCERDEEGNQFKCASCMASEVIGE